MGWSYLFLLVSFVSVGTREMAYEVVGPTSKGVQESSITACQNQEDYEV